MWLGLSCLILHIDAGQAKVCNIYKNTKLKLLKTNAAIWFNKMCKIKQLKPNYIHFKTNGKTLHLKNYAAKHDKCL